MILLKYQLTFDLSLLKYNGYDSIADLEIALVERFGPELVSCQPLHVISPHKLIDEFERLQMED